jgi:two-component system sensor histidine kinase YesM
MERINYIKWKPFYWTRNITQRYNNLLLKQKFMIILFLFLSVVCSVSLLALNYSFKSYDEQLYVQLSRVLNLSLLDIESNINNVEKQSLNMALDTRNQEQLERINNSAGNYEKFRELHDFTNKIQLYSLSEKVVSSISFVDTHGYDLTVGRDLQALNNSQKKNIVQQAIMQKGKLIWIEPDETHPYFIAARAILSIKNTELKPLGTLLFQINTKMLIDQHLKILPYDKTEFFVLSRQKMLFSHRIDSNLDQLSMEFADNQGYTIKTSAGKSYFMAYVTSDRLGWTYVSVLPYDQIFKKNILLRNIVILTFIVLFITAIFIAARLSKNITRPIENLTKQMIIAEKGDFKIPALEGKAFARSDEMGYLQKRFYIMISRINDLIEENYDKQLIIKDTEYKALQAQINPHFLYNTLSSINWIARANNQQSISMMVESLSGLLRSSIGNMEAVISIREEILLLENYINIQKFRYIDRLQFVVEIDEGYKEYRIPKLTLQPIVENAIRHGLENMLDVCKIKITAQDDSGVLVLTVMDNGPGMEAGFLDKLRKHEVEPKSMGIGLKNINERLKLLFGEPYGLEYESKPGDGTKVFITLPLRS